MRKTDKAIAPFNTRYENGYKIESFKVPIYLDQLLEGNESINPDVVHLAISRIPVSPVPDRVEFGQWDFPEVLEPLYVIVKRYTHEQETV